MSAAIGQITEQERRFHMARRQAIIIELGAIEDYLDLPRSIVPRRKRPQPTPAELRDKFDRLADQSRYRDDVN